MNETKKNTPESINESNKAVEPIETLESLREEIERICFYASADYILNSL